jgi:hypothetical protein
VSACGSAGKGERVQERGTGAYTGDLGAREALVGAGAGEVGEALWAPDGGLEVGAVLGGGRVLPDGGIGEGKGVWGEVGEGAEWVQVCEGGLCEVGPVDGAVLLGE